MINFVESGDCQQKTTNGKLRKRKKEIKLEKKQ